MGGIVLGGLYKAFGEKRVLENVSHTFEAGKIHGVMGPSGCGKTTLLHILLGLLKPDAGTVSGANPGALSAVFQEDRLCERLGAGANVRLAAPQWRDRIALRALFEEMGLGGAEKTPVYELSGGMKRRVALLRALAAPSELIVMDEPFTGLDGAMKETVAGCVRRRLDGRTVIMATHSEGDLDLLGGSAGLILPLL
ncbi:MAG: ATP-binding cassette domain-containing protein [Oscillospiraceae bacterium]|jgi:NitT/TauT family transport system ATP-binding protein|nr:ATP-binding cassette domain-containing protein [Oscillospiraceae bacterium]